MQGCQASPGNQWGMKRGFMESIREPCPSYSVTSILLATGLRSDALFLGWWGDIDTWAKKLW